MERPSGSVTRTERATRGSARLVFRGGPWDGHVEDAEPASSRLPEQVTGGWQAEDEEPAGRYALARIGDAVGYYEWHPARSPHSVTGP